MAVPGPARRVSHLAPPVALAPPLFDALRDSSLEARLNAQRPGDEHMALRDGSVVFCFHRLSPKERHTMAEKLDKKEPKFRHTVTEEGVVQLFDLVADGKAHPMRLLPKGMRQ